MAAEVEDRWMIAVAAGRMREEKVVWAGILVVEVEERGD